MTFYPTQTTAVHALKNWTLEHPEAVTKLFECLDRVETVHAPEYNLKFIERPAKAAGVVEAIAQALAIPEDVYAQARNIARTNLEGQVIMAARESFEYYFEQIHPLFDEAAKQYVAAVESLPNDITAEALVSGTPEQLKAYQDAQAAANVLEFVVNWINDDYLIDQGNMGELDKLFTVISVDSVDEFKAIQFYEEPRNADNALKALNLVLFHAVKVGYTLRLATPNEARAELATIVNEYQNS